MKKLSAIIGFGAMLALSGRAEAHHTFSMFDLTQTITMDATVKELQWTSPHMWLQVVVPDENGEAVEWSLETNIAAKIEDGWHRNSLMPGDKVIVVVHPLRRGDPGGQLVGITMPNGKVFTNTLQGQHDLIRQALEGLAKNGAKAK